MANSPALLNGYLQLSAALSAGILPAATRERIALTVAQGNGCSYCLSAHGYVAERGNHLDAEEIAAARRAHADDPKTAAILSLAAVVNDNRGDVPTGVLDSARRAGVTDEEIAETIGHVAFNVPTDYFNKARRHGRRLSGRGALAAGIPLRQAEAGRAVPGVTHSGHGPDPFLVSSQTPSSPARR